MTTPPAKKPNKTIPSAVGDRGLHRVKVINLDPKNFPLLSKEIRVTFNGTEKQFKKFIDKCWAFITDDFFKKL